MFRCLIRHEDHSFVFGSPVSIIGSGFGPGDLGDQIFQSSPVIDLLQEGVHPAVNDAVTFIELVLMMPVMLFVAEDESRVLEEPNDGMGFGVDHVSPFVDLICQNTQNNSKDNSPLVNLTNHTLWLDKKPEPNEERHGVT